MKQSAKEKKTIITCEPQVTDVGDRIMKERKNKLSIVDARGAM